eukprot:g649.t1
MFEKIERRLSKERERKYRRLTNLVEAELSVDIERTRLRHLKEMKEAKDEVKMKRHLHTASLGKDRHEESVGNIMEKKISRALESETSTTANAEGVSSGTMNVISRESSDAMAKRDEDSKREFERLWKHVDTWLDQMKELMKEQDDDGYTEKNKAVFRWSKKEIDDIFACFNEKHEENFETKKKYIKGRDRDAAQAHKGRMADSKKLRASLLEREEELKRELSSTKRLLEREKFGFSVSARV